MAIGLVVLLVALVLVVAAKKAPKQVVMWGVGGAVVGIIVSAIGVLPLVGLTGAGLGMGIGVVVGFVRSFQHAPPARQKTAFDATHAHDNVAINEHRNLLWARDEQGREYTLEAREIRQWNHLWVPDWIFWGGLRGVLEIDVMQNGNSLSEMGLRHTFGQKRILGFRL